MPQSFINRFQTLPAGLREAAVCCLLALAVFAIYSNVYNYDFLLDDQSLIITNVFLRDWHHIPDIFTHLNYGGSGAEKGFYRPVELMLRLVVYQMYGQSQPAFHALNIILHAINAGLVYQLGRKLNFNAGAVFAAALLWSVHPIFTQEVTYISSTSELLWTMFALLGLITLLPDFALRKICFAVVFFVLAIGSKESAVVFPALTAACLFAVSKGKERLKPATYIKTAPFWGLSALYTLIYLHVNSYRPFDAPTPALDAYAHHILPRIFTSLATLPVYLRVVFYPVGLHMERYFPVFIDFFSWPVVIGTVMVVAALAQIIIGRGKHGAALTFGLVWFAIALSPVTGIAIPTDAMISEGWLYMPMIGLSLGAAQMLADWIKGVKLKEAQAFTAVIVTLTAFTLGVKTYFQNEVYQNPVTFYANIFKCGGFRSRAYPDLGVYYLNHKEFDKAAENFELAIENPNERNVPSVAMHAQLALAYLGVVSDSNYMITPDAVKAALPYTNKIPEAIDELDESLRLDPDFFFAHTLLGAIYQWQGDERAYEYHHQKMLEILHRQGKI